MTDAGRGDEVGAVGRRGASPPPSARRAQPAGTEEAVGQALAEVRQQWRDGIRRAARAIAQRRLLRHEHPSRPGDDYAGRSGPRRLRVRRRGGLPPAERRARPRYLPDARGRVAGRRRTGPAPRQGAQPSTVAGASAPVVHFDNEHSRKYTVLEIVADDAPGLLYRISRASRARAATSTRAHRDRRQRAIDVLHVTKEGASCDGPARSDRKT